MFSGTPSVMRTSASPFDKIRRARPDGSEYWSAREMMDPLGYQARNWQRFLAAIGRAKLACGNSGQDIGSHFTHISETPKGGGPPRVDVEMSRLGCYFLAMNGDPAKPEVAAAQQYFAIMTRAAELHAVERAEPQLVVRAWSERLQATVQPHLLDMELNYPECFSVVSAFSSQILLMEDMLIRHAFSISQSDRPDISIGACWAGERRDRGMPPARRESQLRLPDVDFPVRVLIYSNSEFFACKQWFREKYLTEKVSAYMFRKPEFKPYGKLACASVAENTCLSLTGRPAHLPPKYRNQLAAANGFWPADRELSQLPSPGRSLFGESA